MRSTLFATVLLALALVAPHHAQAALAPSAPRVHVGAAGTSATAQAPRGTPSHRTRRVRGKGRPAPPTAPVWPAKAAPAKEGASGPHWTVRTAAARLGPSADLPIVSSFEPRTRLVVRECAAEWCVIGQGGELVYMAARDLTADAPPAPIVRLLPPPRVVGVPRPAAHAKAHGGAAKRGAKAATRRTTARPAKRAPSGADTHPGTPAAEPTGGRTARSAPAPAGETAAPATAAPAAGAPRTRAPVASIPVGSAGSAKAAVGAPARVPFARPGPPRTLKPVATGGEVPIPGVP